jgi:hypothetical protein
LKESVKMIGSKRESVRVFMLVLTAVLGQSLAACSGQASGTVAPPPATVAQAPTQAPTSAAPTIAPTTAPTKAPTPTPALPAPAELQGRWRAVIPPGVAILAFTATDYTQSWLGGGSGRIEVEGDEITFLGSHQCPGSGTYRWSIEDDKLHLEPVGTDACPFRAEWARKGTYTRYD